MDISLTATSTWGVFRPPFHHGTAQQRLESADAPREGDAAVPWEAECLRHAQQGRPEAFNPLVAHYAPRIRAYIQRMVRNREEAEDLTQETFLRAYRGLARFDADRPFKRWIFTIATNSALNAIRGEKRRGLAVELDESLPAGSARPAERCDERGEQLERALAALAPRAAQLITLHYHENFSLKEAGELLGMSEGAAKVALCRARRELREVMKGKR